VKGKHREKDLLHLALLRRSPVACTGRAGRPAPLWRRFAFAGATLSHQRPDARGLGQATGPRRASVATVAELLSQSNEILEDAVFKEGNLPTGHRVTIRTGLPTVYWRSLNQGIPNSKSTTAQVDESCGMLEARSEIDKDLAKLNGNTAQFRLSEDKAFLESMNQTQASTMFYGNPGTDPRQYLGLAPRYGAISGAATRRTSSTPAARRRTTPRSGWWAGATRRCSARSPRARRPAWIHEDLGEQTVYGTDPAGNATRMQALQPLPVEERPGGQGLALRRAHLQHQHGQPGGQHRGGRPDRADVARDGPHPGWGMGRPAFYMNRTVYSILRLQALNKSAERAVDREGPEPVRHAAVVDGVRGRAAAPRRPAAQHRGPRGLRRKPCTSMHFSHCRAPSRATPSPTRR
jgi:hypothetical protein